MNFLKKRLTNLKVLWQYSKMTAIKAFYNDFFQLAEQSKTHALFCERVYGKNLCQQGMMDMAQLQKLLEVLDLDKHNHVLELGCGNGLITEYISDITGANITGVDISEKAIKQAQERTAGKQHRLTFNVRDLNQPDFPVHNFDAIIAVDVLHLLKDLKEAICLIKAILKPNGQLGILFTQRIPADGSKELLLPDKTELAQALKENNFNFQTRDFSREERNHWRKKARVLEELEPEFEREGNIFLYKLRLYEAKSIVKRENRRCRYLYYVH